MDYARPTADSLVTLVCYPSGGASIRTDDGYVWCGSTRLSGWQTGDHVEAHARYWLHVEDALRFARGCGWVGE